MRQKKSYLGGQFFRRRRVEKAANEGSFFFHSNILSTYIFTIYLASSETAFGLHIFILWLKYILQVLTVTNMQNPSTYL